MTKTRSVTAAALTTLAALLSACSADFKDGVTTCSAQNLCPDGFYCDVNGGRKCRKNGSPPMPGTGGMSVLPGTGGMMPLPPPVDMAPPPPVDMAPPIDNRPPPPVDMAPPPDTSSSMCTDPMKPKMCPDLNGVQGFCVSTAGDCSTLGRCGTTRYVCEKGEMLNCQYHPVNPCSPIGNMCTTDPRYTKFCPAAGGAGPVCVTPMADCATLKACGEDLVICGPGDTVDCTYAVNRCVFPPTGCTDPMFPTYCAGMGMIGPGCASAGADCTTRTLCADGRVGICAPGARVDCTKPVGMRCVPK